MRYELKWGISNNVGADFVGVMQVYEGSARLSICHSDPPGREEYLKVPVGGLMEIDGGTWRLISVHERGKIPEGAPPGTGSGRLAAVIEQEADGDRAASLSRSVCRGRDHADHRPSVAQAEIVVREVVS